MSSLSRALSNATHSTETLQTELEFISAVGVPLHLALAFLALALFTFTSPEARSLRNHAIRFMSGIGSIWYFYDFGFRHYVVHDERISRQVYSGLAPIALYGIMRAIDACFISPLVASSSFPPRHVPLPSSSETPAKSHKEALLPLPTTLKDRLIYALDLLSSMRGLSWYRDRRWDFASSTVLNLQSGVARMSRREYLINRAKWWVIYYIMVDLVDTWVKSIPWSLTAMYPVSQGLPVHQQLVASLLICVWTYLAIVSEATLLSLIFVGSGLSQPQSWVEMLDYPLAAANLPEFWGRRWHYIFRRTFDQMLLPFLSKPSSKVVEKGKKVNGSGLDVNVRKLSDPASTEARLLAHPYLRSFLTFVLSTLLHLITMHRNPPSPRHPYGDFWDPSILAFFLAQPIGVIVDSLILRRLGGKDSATLRYARRAFAWGWLLWTARWWADCWVRKGMWDSGEQIVQWSPVRGILWGDWYAQRGLV